MIYYVQPGDMLWKVALKLGTTVDRILKYNILCNPNYIFPGELIYLPANDDYDMRAGYYPYYVIRRGDTLFCLANTMGIKLNDLIYMNRSMIKDPNLLYFNNELLTLSFYLDKDPEALLNSMESYFVTTYCEALLEESFMGRRFEDFTFNWEAIGVEGIRYLIKMLKHTCYAMRYNAAKSLGRIGASTPEVISALNEAADDSNDIVSNMAQVALKRIELIKLYGKRIHVTERSVQLLSEPSAKSPIVDTFPSGTEFIVLKWNIPNFDEINEAGFRYYDYVRILRTVSTGFILRPNITTAYMI